MPPEKRKFSGSRRNRSEEANAIYPELSRPLSEVPPEHLCEEAAQIWFELTEVAPKGCLGESDKYIVELACNLIAQFRNDPVEFSGARIAQLVQCLGKIGLTPVDRVKMGIIPGDAKPKNPFNEF